MKILKNLSELENFTDKTALTVGTFDGVHLGHRLLLEKLSQKAERKFLKTALVTFSPHPQEILKNKKKPIGLLSNFEEKVFLLEKTGLDILFVIPFSLEFAQTSAVDFCKNYLIQGLNASEIIVGYDHAFGKNREGSLQTLKDLSVEFDYGIELVEEFNLEGHKVNSTTIRKLIAEDNLQKVNQLLGYEYLISGKVTNGDQRGRVLGFPTANLKMNPNKLLPTDGVYAVRVAHKSKDYNGVLNIGSRPTFYGQSRSVEVFIFDFDEEIYGENLRLSLVEKIRSEKKFDGIEELKSQIQKDVVLAKKIIL
ncbi:MAG: bifunctional riboflavin kinase/FAD synthetase [Calditrichaeota bacterium]|nr:MAG: bifunctional riboflavin kinase/FAD synthetase [Calditrichota bacterium]